MKRSKCSEETEPAAKRGRADRPAHDAAVHQRDPSVAAKEAELAAKEAALEAKKRLLEAKKRELEARKRELKAKERELKAKKRELKAREAEVEAERGLAERRARDAAAQHQRTAVKAYQAERQAEQEELEAAAVGAPRFAAKVDAWFWRGKGVHRDENKWELDPDATTFFRGLKAAELRPISELLPENARPTDCRGIKGIRLGTRLFKDQPEVIILRPQVIELWELALKRLTQPEPSNTVVDGLPGIGKSCSLFYLLRLLLLSRSGRPVVFEHRGQQCVYAILQPPGAAEPKVWSASLEGFRYACPILKDSSTVYIIEPGETRSPPECVYARTLLSRSTTSSHFYNGLCKSKADFWHLRCPVPAADDLVVVRGLLPVDGRVLEAEEVVALHAEFGGVLRTVFGNAAYRERVKLFRKMAIGALEPQDLEYIEKGSFEIDDERDNERSLVASYEVESPFSWCDSRSVFASARVRELVMERFRQRGSSAGRARAKARFRS